jgi:hypothetical protein
MISWLLLIELAGFCYCIGQAADHLSRVHIPDQVKKAIFYFALAAGCAVVALYGVAQM